MTGAAAARVVVRPVGTPLPLGFLGLLVATASLSTVQLGWLPSDQEHVVALVILGFTVPAQLLVCVLGFLTRDPVAGTGVGVLAGTWSAVALTTLASPAGTQPTGLGVVLLVAAVALLVPTLAAGGKLVAALVMGVSALRFAVTGIAVLTGSDAWTTAAGVAGLLLAAVALYAALAFELEGVHHRDVLPVLRRGPGAATLDGDLDDQLGDLAREAGVRRQL